MKSALYTFLCVFALGHLSLFGLPWWSIVPIGALAGWFLHPASGRGFAAGFLGGALLWLVHAYLLDHANASLLSARIGKLFLGLGSGQLLGLTGVLGGLLSGLGVLAGIYAREFVAFLTKKG